MSDLKIKKLENDIRELSELFIKNDEGLRKMIRDIRIANAAGVTATEFTLANRLMITIDVVLAMLPDEVRPSIEKVIESRVNEIPNTSEIAMTLARDLYKKEGDDY